MSRAVEDAIAAREAAKRPAPEPEPEPEAKPRRKAKAPEPEFVETVSTGDDPGFTTFVEREADEDPVFEADA